MPFTAEQIIAEIKTQGQRCTDYRPLISEFVTAAPDNALNFLRAAMELDRPGGLGVLAPLVYGYVRRDDYEELLRDAMQVKRLRWQRYTVDYAARQFPQLMTPYLDWMLFEHPDPLGELPCGAWRAASGEDIARVKEFLSRPAPALDNADVCEGIERRRRFARACLLLTDQPDAIRWTIRNATRTGRRGTPATNIGGVLESIGWEVRWTRLRRFASERTFHIVFPAAYMGGAVERTVHPTWQLPDPDGHLHHYGGFDPAECPSCGGRVMHMLTIHPVPDGIGVESVKSLSLPFCYRCALQQDAYYRHDKNGRAVLAKSGAKASGGNLACLTPCTVRLAPTPSRWLSQDWGGAGSWENLHRVGGMPAWVQQTEYKICSRCRRRMQFLAQFMIDDMPMEDGEVWGMEGGLLYAFWCDRCRVSKWGCQCT